jgi:hypothetical protein
MKIPLEDFEAKVVREHIFKPTIGNESLPEISNDNGVIVVDFTTSSNLTIKSTMIPLRNIRKYNWTHNRIDHILRDRRRHSSEVDVRSLGTVVCDTGHYLVQKLILVGKRLERESKYVKNYCLRSINWLKNCLISGRSVSLYQFTIGVIRLAVVIIVGKEVLYNILIEFGVPMKLVRFINNCLNET